MVQPPSPPYIPANLQGGPQDRIDRIVIHGTVSPTECGGARSIANYFHNLQPPPAGRWASCHYVVDPCEIVQCVYDHTVAYHAPPNEGSIGFELCDPQAGPDSRWDDPEHEAMLDIAAANVRQLCLAYDIPMRWLMPDELRAGARGITDHENVGAAWGQTSHVDPGWSTARSDDFMRRVLSGDTAPTESEDDMQADERAALMAVYNQLAGSWTVGEYNGWPSRVDPEVSLTPVDTLRYVDLHVVQLKGMVAGLTDAVKALASSQGVDADALLERVEQTVKATIAESTVNVDVNVAGGDAK